LLFVCLQMKGADIYTIVAAVSIQVIIKHVDCIDVGSHPMFIYAMFCFLLPF
jgi:hypothetical protein